MSPDLWCSVPKHWCSKNYYTSAQSSGINDCAKNRQRFWKSNYPCSRTYILLNTSFLQRCSVRELGFVRRSTSSAETIKEAGGDQHSKPGISYLAACTRAVEFAFHWTPHYISVAASDNKDFWGWLHLRRQRRQKKSEVTSTIPVHPAHPEHHKH